jgi:tRNA A37 threonylcarbamoyladenosine modification protein TsaB
VSTLHAYAGGRPVIDARRGEVFTAGPALARPDELDVRGQRLVGDGAVRFRSVFESAGAAVPPDGDAAHLPAARLLVGHATTFGPVEQVDPLYLRAPDAKPARP